MSACFVYVTASDGDEARRIGRALVEARLAACANVLGEITSIYWWEGEVQEGGEIALIAKTRTELVPALTEKVKALHSYSCPCVVAWPLTAGNKSFLDWVLSETGAAG